MSDGTTIDHAPIRPWAADRGDRPSRRQDTGRDRGVYLAVGHGGRAHSAEETDDGRLAIILRRPSN